MNIKVKKIIKSKNIILFETSVGIGKGIWMSQVLPKLNNLYEVEFEITDDLVWEKNVFFASDNNEEIKIDSEYLCIQGKVERVEQDGLVIFRLGSSIIMLDNFTEPPPSGSFIRFKVRNPQLFNANI